MRKIIDGKVYDTETHSYVGFHFTRASNERRSLLGFDIHHTREGEFFFTSEHGELEEAMFTLTFGGDPEGGCLMPVPMWKALEVIACSRSHSTEYIIDLFAKQIAAAKAAAA